MRTTVTLDPDTEELIRKRMHEQGVSFKQALNDAIRAGLAKPRSRKRFETEVAAMGKPRFSIERALSLAGQLEDEEILRKISVGK